MAEEASRKAQEDSQIEVVFCKACQTYGHKGQGIVKEHLYGVEDEGILQEVDKAVEKACHSAYRGAEAVGNQHDGQHASKGKETTLRKVEDAELMQHYGDGEHQGDINQHPGGEVDFSHVDAAAGEGKEACHGEKAGGTG